jgi:translocation and assembly module TamB
VTLSKYLLRGTVTVLLLVASAWFWLLHTESGASWVWNRVVSASDDTLSGQYVGGDFAAGIDVRQLRLSTDALDIEVDTTRAALNLDLVPLQATLSGVHLSNVKVATTAVEAGEEAAIDVEALLSGLRLPLRIDLLDARVDNVSVSIGDGEALSIDRVDASIFWHNEISIRNLAIQTSDVAASAEGTVQLVDSQQIRLQLDASTGTITLRAGITGDWRSLEVRDVVVAGDGIDARGSATVQLIDELSGNAIIQIDRFEPNTVVDDWPDGHPLRGAIKVEGSRGVWQFSDSSVSIENSQATLQFDAKLDQASSTVSANLRWHDLQWPVDVVQPAVTSADGNVVVAGSLDDWSIEGSAAIGTEDMPDGRFQIAGGGDSDRVALTIEDGRVFGGSIVGNAEYSWREQQLWSANLDVQNLLTDGILPDWPGSVSGHAEANGTQNPFAIDASVENVTGQIRGASLTADGSFAYASGVATADELSITHGSTKLWLDGSADTTEGLEFKANVPKFESYLESVSGGFDASGLVSRVQGSPYLSLNLDSDELLFGEIRIAGVRVRDERGDGAVAGVSVQVDELHIADQAVSGIELHAVVTPLQQLFGLSGNYFDSQISLELDGAFDDWNAFLESPWRGEINSFSVDLQDEHSLRLDEPAAMEYSTNRISINDFCLSDSGQSHLCLDVASAASGQSSLKAVLENIPLALIEHVIASGLSFDQKISGSINWSADPDAGANGRGEFKISEGVVGGVDDTAYSFSTGEGVLFFEVTDGNLLAGEISIPLPEIGSVDGDFRFLDVTQLASSDVSGHLKLEMSDIGIVAHIIPQLNSASGAVKANIELTGNATNPQLTGNFVVENAALDYRPIGLQLEDVNLVGDLTENQAIELSGQFRAGEGYGELVSSADYNDIEKPGIRFKLRGDNLQLVDVEDIQLRVNPDLEIAYYGSSIDINGSLLIPSARIAPANLAENRISESDDVVIVRGEHADNIEVSEPTDPLQFGGELKVQLGKQVIVDLGLAKANLSGSALFAWNGAAMPMVDGRYDLEGDIKAFGQVLDITEGGIIYANAPASAPYLRIRAEREIYGNSQVKRAGVLVTGMANRPTIEAYTYPMTSEERALTLLVTGSDFDYEQGVGAVDFGTYIAPRLFVSYGIGIFDRENVVSARYDLAKGFGIKATSGSKESGFDLNYRFEN